MDTKLKRASYSFFTKAVAFLLVIMCFGLALTTFENLATSTAGRNTNEFEPLIQPSFVNSSELFNYEFDFYTGLNNLLKFKNEDNIKQGNTINKYEFENEKRNLYYQWYFQIYQNTNGYDDVIYNELKEKFEAENADRINETREEMIDNQLRSYYSLLQRVKNKEGLYYYATDGENTYTNTDKTDRSYFEGFKAYFIFDNTGSVVKPSTQAYSFQFSDASIGSKIYIAATDQYIAKRQAEWDNQRYYLTNGVIIIASAVSLLLAAFIFLVWRAGRKEENKDINLSIIDKLYTDVNIAAILGVVFAWFELSVAYLESNAVKFINAQSVFWLVLLFNVICCSIGLALLLSLVRHFKNKTLIKHSILYNISIKLLKAIKVIINSGPLTIRIVAIILASEFVIFILTALMMSMHSIFTLFWLFILCALSIGGIYYAILKIKSFTDIANGVQEIKNGNLEHIIAISGEGDFSRLANDINDIADGLKSAVVKETKAERMKSELITNVSHDLKTPLTSIINYVDLLSKEKLTPEKANDYVAILKQKSEKLKQLTQDLFEVSKVQSGNISIDLEKIDASVLLKQSLAEFDEQISLSGLDFKVNIQDKDTFIMADGKRLSRVFENLIGNILKYSLASTRVYVDVFTDKNSVYIEFKNIANYEMNFKEDEILERFVRGDKSRTTEGSGLGLAIAQSYVTACGGSLQINVDGDLFKGTLKFNKA